MIKQSTLFEAKAFLCWEKFPQLAIKITPIQEAVAFFYPPGRDFFTINVFYEKHTQDFSSALFLLFHESGHLVQWQQYSSQNRIAEFWHLLDLDKDAQKIEFEREAWCNGKALLGEFLERTKLKSDDLIASYRRFSEQCLLTYQ